MNIGQIIGIIIAVVVVILIVALVAWTIKGYNKLVQARNRVKNSWAQIDVQLKKRFDLIPNLVETVKGYANMEENILTKFAEARGSYQKASAEGDVAGVAKSNEALTKALSIFVNAVHEQYPEIKANVNFQSLMNDLKDCENKIAYNRQFYNDTVLTYNNLREMFPTVIIASMFHFEAAEFFKIDEESKEAPKVKF